MRHILAFLSAGVLALGPSAGLAQDWPGKPIRVVIPFAAGSVSEAIFRTISPGVEAHLGQRFIVESKPGADGAIGTGEVVRAAPDGYTLLLGPTAVYAVTPHMFRNLGFDPLTALDPISLLADAPLLAVIGTNVPARSLKELAGISPALHFRSRLETRWSTFRTRARPPWCRRCSPAISRSLFPP